MITKDQHKTENQKFLSADQVGELFSVHGNTAKNWSRSGVLPAPYKIGNVLRWKASDVESFIAKLEPATLEEK